MKMPSEWGKSGYDDLLKKYKVGRGRLYFILTDELNNIAKTLKISKKTIIDFRDRHTLILKQRKQKRDF